MDSCTSVKLAFFKKFPETQEYDRIIESAILAEAHDTQANEGCSYVASLPRVFDRICQWYETGLEFRSDDILCFIANTRRACVLMVLMKKELHKEAEK